MSSVARLRDATRTCHDTVDVAFSIFDLADRIDYGRFLLAHAQATRAAELRLYEDSRLPVWRPRTSLLTDDLAALGLATPTTLAFVRAEDDAWRWGVLYVLEGSRLGASVLVKRTPPGTPSAYLSARHLPGEWRCLLSAIDVQGSAMGTAWTDAAIVGARACFDLYERAAAG